jgi:hypothetical protein
LGLHIKIKSHLDRQFQQAEQRFLAAIAAVVVFLGLNFLGFS